MPDLSRDFFFQQSVHQPLLPHNTEELISFEHVRDLDGEWEQWQYKEEVRLIKNMHKRELAFFTLCGLCIFVCLYFILIV